MSATNCKKCGGRSCVTSLGWCTLCGAEDGVEEVPLEWMQTISGRRVYPARLRVEDIDIEDIAHALSGMCRFAGHCKHFYGVAQHSVLVAEYVMARKRPLNEARWALLHDASEAYLGDITWPLKRHPAMRGYRDLERDAMSVIATCFGLEGPEPPIVKEADLAILATEKRDLLNAGPSHDDKAVREVAAVRKTHDDWHCDHVEPNVDRIVPMYPPEARGAFLDLFYRDLFPEHPSTAAWKSRQTIA